MLEKSKIKKIVARSQRDLEFICRQILRFTRMQPKELIAHVQKHREDMFCTIPHPNGGHLQCSALGWRKFSALADRVIDFEPKLARRVEPEQVKKAVIDAFVQRVLKEKRELNLETCEQILRDVAEKSRKSLQDTEHYLPCVLFLRGGPDEFSIGPVTFVRRIKFFRDRRQALRQSAVKNEAAHIEQVNEAVEHGFPRERAASTDLSRKFVRGLQARAIKTYRGYPWVACVRVVNCDHETSKRLAANVVETALHVIRIFLGAARTKRVRLAWSRGDALRTAGLWSDSEGVIHTRIGSQSIGPVGFENWHDGLIQNGGYELKIFSSALVPLADPKKTSQLHARFIDAINWFGDAATDTEPTASVVKYVSSIERLLFGEYERGRKKAFANRAEKIFKAFNCEDSERTYADALNVYAVRSALLHGASSPRDADARKLVVVAEELARLCLFCVAQLYPMMKCAYKDLEPEKLEKVMKMIEREGLEPLARDAGWTRRARK